jgi:hypothetical protein
MAPASREVGLPSHHWQAELSGEVYLPRDCLRSAPVCSVCQQPRESHDNAIKYLFRYFLETKDKGIILRPDVTKSFEVHVDCDFAGN